MCLITCDMYRELPSMPARQKASCYGRRTRARSRWLGLIELKLIGGRERDREKEKRKKRGGWSRESEQSNPKAFFFSSSFIRFSNKKKKKSSGAVKVEARQ